MKKSVLKKGINRRDFLKLTVAAACFSLAPPFTKKVLSQTPSVSELFWVTDIPEVMSNGNYHAGIDGLLNIMGSNGLKFYRSSTETNESGPLGMISPNDVVLIKVNAQWKYRGCTNSDLIRGLIQRILDHPDGFTGEVVIFENGQGRGSLHCDTMGGDYPAGTHANAEDESHSFVHVIDTIFNDQRVSYYLLDPIRTNFIDSNEHATDGYRTFENVSYPCFTTTGRHRVELREGIWNESSNSHSQNLKLINIPVLKHHDTGGSEITASLKHFYGVLSMSDGQSGVRHYAGLGETCGKMVASVRTPVLNIIDAIWVSHGSLGGYPKNTTTRMNQIIASQDPVALDHWAAKYILYPIHGNDRHHPDFPGIATWINSAAVTINDRGPLQNQDRGIFVSYVTNEEAKMVTNRLAIAPPDIVLSPSEGTIGTEIAITGSGIPATSGKVVIGGVVARILNQNVTAIHCLLTKVTSSGPAHVTLYQKPYKKTSPTMLTSAFTIRGPELDDLPVSQGSPGDERTISGKFFGTRKGKVYLEYTKGDDAKKAPCHVVSWAMDPQTGASTIVFRVPKTLDPGTYQLKVMNRVGTEGKSFAIVASR